MSRQKDILSRLAAVIEDRKLRRPEKSYTAELLENRLAGLPAVWSRLHAALNQSWARVGTELRGRFLEHNDSRHTMAMTEVRCCRA